MTAMYNYGYDEPVASVTIEPPQYEDIDQITRTIKPPKYENEKHGKTNSAVLKPSSANQDLCSNLQTAGNAVTNSTPKNSVCRPFLIIVLTLVIGCAVGGVVMYLWTQQTSSNGISSEVSEDSTSTAKDSNEVNPPSMSPIPSMSPTQDAFDPGFPKDCQEVKDRGHVASGQYIISPHDDEAPFRVYCDMETVGGGWTVFQRREDGSVNFFLGWTEYENGFGDVNSEHWLGNQKIHRMTTQHDKRRYELRIDMADFDGNTAYATYDNFLIANGANKYKLLLGGYSGGDAGDSLSYHKDRVFSTKDADDTTCAALYSGAWWYKSCHYSNLNGPYKFGVHESYADGVNWRTWKGYHYSLKHVEMKIRMVR